MPGPGEETPLLSRVTEVDAHSWGSSSSTNTQQPLVLAALHVVEALKSQPTTPFLVSVFELPSSSSNSYMRMYGLRRSVTGLRKTITTALILLTFLEPPRWSPEEGIDEQQYPGFAALRWSSDACAAIEMSALAFLLSDVLVKAFYLSPEGSFSAANVFRKEGCVRWSMLSYFASLVLLSLTYPLSVLSPVLSVLPRPYLRLMIFSSSHDMLREWATIVSILPELLRILSLQLIIMLLYAWGGCVIFSNEDEEGSEDFPDFGGAVWTLWILVTTANFPDVMMPSYDSSRFSVIYFGSFLIICFYFMTNLLLGAIYSNYKTEMDDNEVLVADNSKANLVEAFRLLDSSGEGYISIADLSALFDILNQTHSEVGEISQERARLLFAILDGNGDDVVDEGEFVSFCNVLMIEFTSAESYKGMLEKHFHEVWASPYFQFVRSPSFDVVMNTVLIANALLIAYQSYHELIGDKLSGRKYDPVLLFGIASQLDFLFTCVYLLEVALRVLANGTKAYWESNRNRFDFLVTFLTTATCIVVYLPNSIDDTKWLRFAALLRLLRLLRLFVALEQFRVIGSTLNEISPVVARVASVLGCTLFVFAAVGVEVFGGKISTDPGSAYFQRLEGSDYAKNGYYANNFNDFSSR